MLMKKAGRVLWAKMDSLELVAEVCRRRKQEVILANTSYPLQKVSGTTRRTLDLVCTL